MNYSSSVLLMFLLSTFNVQDKLFELVSSVYKLTSEPNELNVDDTTVFENEYDFVIVGAGTAGSLLANRLTENPNWNVLLLEAGRDEMFITDVPLSAPILGRTSYNWGYKAEKMKKACLGIEGGRCAWPKGKAVGGSSTINYMVYTRGNKYNYDQWESFGNPGWGYKDVLPYFIKSERAVDLVNVDDEYHGTDGYLNVEHSPYRTAMVEPFLKAAKEFGYKITDPNGENQIGFSVLQATTRNGRRCSASKAFLRSIRKRPNLHVAKEARVLKVLIDPVSKEAFGVEFIKNNIKRKVKAKKEVILSAGSINSPQLLMLSGVGPREHLEELNIPVVKDLRVGFNLHDHQAAFGLVFLINESLTITSDSVQQPSSVINYFVNHNGPLTMSGGAEAIAFVKTKYNTADYPDIELVLGSSAIHQFFGSFRAISDLPDSFYDKVFGDEKRSGFTIISTLLDPESRGRLMLRSTNPYDWPLMYGNYFDDERDLKKLVEGIKMAVAVGEAASFQKYDSKLYPVPYPGCEHLPFRSDSYWGCYIQWYTESFQHQSGTCKMGPSTDPGAVVDPELRVYGVGRLRVIDASIMPTPMCGHTNAPTFMIGEKGADFIKKTWA